MGVHRRMNHIRPSTPPTGEEDRRSSCRYNVVEDQSWLGWWEGANFVTTPSRIIDLSLRGALLQVETLPTTDQSVWLCPPGSVTPEWLEARLVQARKKLLGPREVRIAFRRLFPYETFKALIYGRGSASPIETQPYYVDTESDPDEW